MITQDSDTWLLKKSTNNFLVPKQSSVINIAPTTCRGESVYVDWFP